MTLFAIVISRQVALYQKHKSGIIYFISAIGFLVFMALGAYMFLLIEGNEFEEAQRAVLEAKDKIRKKYPQMSAEALEDFLEELRIVGLRGLPKRNNTIVKWRFADSWFFVVTLLTTVGYGHFTPRTLLGKIFCIAYTSMGIPLTLLHLAYYVDKLQKISEGYKAAVFRQYHGKIKPFFIRFIHVTTLMSFIVLICFILPGSFFAAMEEDWGTFDGIYFTFISLTTVGLGDLVPAMNPDMLYGDLYKISTSFFLLGGITIIMFMMAMWGDYFRNYNNDYQQLPFTIPTEKFLINPGTVHTYGSIITNSGKSEADEKSLLPK